MGRCIALAEREIARAEIQQNCLPDHTCTSHHLIEGHGDHSIIPEGLTLPDKGRFACLGFVSDAIEDERLRAHALDLDL